MPARNAAGSICLAVAFIVGPGCGNGAASDGTPAPAERDPITENVAETIPVTAPAEPEVAAPPPATSRPEPPAPTSYLEVYAPLLAETVTPEGLVRYDRLAEPEREAALRTVVRLLAEAPRPADRAGRKALWSNAYNANVLALALRESRKPGFTTVTGVPGFFDAMKITVAGETLTLNDLENKRIRPLGDARIHAALVCAAMSCPPLRTEPYAADQLEAQLDDQCRRWVNDETKFRIEDGKLGMNEILKWYDEDFRRRPYGNPTGFVLAYADPAGPIARYVINAPRTETTWIPYDWTLNRAPKQERK